MSEAAKLPVWLDDQIGSKIKTANELELEVLHVVYDPDGGGVGIVTTIDDSPTLMLLLSHLVEQIDSGKHFRDRVEVDLT